MLSCAFNAHLKLFEIKAIYLISLLFLIIFLSYLVYFRHFLIVLEIAYLSISLFIIIFFLFVLFYVFFYSTLHGFPHIRPHIFHLAASLLSITAYRVDHPCSARMPHLRCSCPWLGVEFLLRRSNLKSESASYVQARRIRI